ncbi:MAG: ABC transporter ATP-binding protein, partial [Treponema sp.]|nr:ABC transporter ATP-binding protein [Treponema sp.]
MASVIEFDGVGFWAQGRALVSGLSIGFEEKSAVALIGPSGGGKSTILKLAAGLCIPGAGRVLFRGRGIWEMSRSENLAFRKEAAFVFQDSALWANQSLFQILELPLRVHFPGMSAGERKLRVESAAARVGYRRDLGMRPAALSRGEQKLVAFARAIICEPTLLFLDEWTESLDEKSAQRLIAIVKKMKEDGATLIFVSHDVRVIRGLSDVVLLVSGGGISSRLSADEIAGEG